MSDASVGKDMAGVASAKLRADKRCRLLSKLLPEQYGDRVQVEHSGETRVSLYLPDKRRQLPGDNAPIIDGTAQELNSDESPEMQTNPVRFLNQVADLQSIGKPPRAWW